LADGYKRVHGALMSKTYNSNRKQDVKVF